jgi:hypothetical protein
MFSNMFVELYPYRKTDGCIKYIQFPGDDRQLKKEFPDLLDAFYGSAAKHLADWYGRIPSPKEVKYFEAKEHYTKLTTCGGCDSAGHLSIKR